MAKVAVISGTRDAEELLDVRSSLRAQLNKECKYIVVTGELLLFCFWRVECRNVDAQLWNILQWVSFVWWHASLSERSSEEYIGQSIGIRGSQW